MINLLPFYDRRRLRNERLKRTLAAFGFFVMAILALGFVMWLPSLIALRYMIADFSYVREAEERSPSNRALEERTRTLTDVESRARRVFGYGRATPSFDTMLEEIIRIAPAGIDLTTMRFEEKSLIIEGHYAHRSLLIAFLEALKTNPSVKSVSSPLSNLLQEMDAPFLLTLAL